MLGGGSVCTDYNRILAHQDKLVPSIDSITKLLSDQFSARSSILSTELAIDGVAREVDSTYKMRQSFERHGFSVWEKPIESSYTIDLPETWDEFMSNLSQSARRKAKKALSRIDKGECSFHSSSDPHELKYLLCQLAGLHQARRRRMGQAGSYAVKHFARFLMEAVDLLADQRQVRMEWIEHQGQVVAMHLLLLGSKTVYMYQSGIENELMHLEPGHCLTVCAIRNAISLGVNRYDFLRGDEPYKVFWVVPKSHLQSLYSILLASSLD